MNIYCQKNVKLITPQLKITAYKSLIILFFLCSLSCKNIEKENNKFSIKRGINISHWLSQNPDQGEARCRLFSENDVKFISKAGFDHLRIPVDEEHLWDIQSQKHPGAFKLLHNAIVWCIKNDMRVILDLHVIRSHSFNNKTNLLWTSPKEKKHFVQLWIQLSNEFKKYSNNSLAYELLNEAVADNPEDWNDLVAITLDTLRKMEPNRKFVIGSNLWQSPGTFHQLRIPVNDKNIILSFHFYSPFIFTHYQASWMITGQYNGPIKYPGQVINEEILINDNNLLVEELKKYNGFFTKDTLLKLIREPIEYAKKYGLQLYCGEFGCMPTVHRIDRLQWYRDVREIFEKNNIAWSKWDYKGAFAIFNRQTGDPDKKLISVLTDPLN